MSSLFRESQFYAQAYHRDGAGAVIAAPGVTYAMRDEVTASSHPVSASTHFDGRIIGGALEEWAFAPGGTRGAREIWNGSCVLENSDGALDAWATRNVHLTTFLISHMFPLYPFSTMFKSNGVTELVDVGNRDVAFHLRDLAVKLDVPALTNVYAGTNTGSPLAGVEGTATSLKGLRKPWVMGVWYGFTPLCVNTDRQIYQVDGQRGFATGWSLTVKDRGVALTAGADYASQADMEANVPAAGTYRVWPAGGMFRVGSTPAGQLTTDGTNPVATTDALPNGGSGSAAHHIIGALHRAAFPSSTLDVEQNPGPATAMSDAGIVITDDETILQAVNRVAAGCGAGWTFSSTDEKLTLQRISSPSAFVADSMWEFNEDTIEAPGGRTSLHTIPTRDSDQGVPVWRVNVLYARNHTVQTREELAGAVSAADVAFAAQEWRKVTASDSSVLTQWPNAPEITIESCYVNEADASSLATLLLNIYKVRRDVFQCDVSMAGHVKSENPSVTVSMWSVGQNNATLIHSRFGLSGGRGVRVIGRRVNLDRNNITYTLWG